MNTNLATVPTTELAPLQPDLTLSRAPSIVLEEARQAAHALADVLAAKPKKVILNNEQYLEFEDWQTLGRFYGVTAKVVTTTFIDYGDIHGFEARATAIRADGFELSAAEAACLTDEPHWRTRPMFQLKSMAQTRAAAKVLRNVLSWVVVLAGYRPTPAEELNDIAPAERVQPVITVVAVTVKIVNIVKRPTKDAVGHKFVITADDQHTYHTFSLSQAEAAKSAKEAGIPVSLTYKDTKYGRMIQTLNEIEPSTPEPPY
jgi:hypothetical protein